MLVLLMTRFAGFGLQEALELEIEDALDYVRLLQENKATFFPALND